jgi:hypothetical protein
MELAIRVEELNGKLRDLEVLTSSLEAAVKPPACTAQGILYLQRRGGRPGL